MKKTILQFIIIVTLSSAVFANGVHASEKAFTDVSIYYWAKPNIDHLAKLGAIDGKSDGTFGIGENVTRAAASKIIVESLGLKLVETNKKVFTDVSNNHWAKNYIETLASHGIIDGLSNGTFKPNASLTRAQMAKILTNSFNLTKESEKPFKDVQKSDWAYDYVMKLSGSGITTGYEDNTYRPAKYVTREQMVVFLSRGIVNRDHITLPAPVKNPVKRTDKNPGSPTVNDPIMKLPGQAKLFENDRALHRYHYKINLPGGGTVSEVTASRMPGENTIYVKGKDKSGDSYSGRYVPLDSVRYANYLPKISDDAYIMIDDIAEEFAVSYGWQDVYHLIQLNIAFKGESHYTAASTNSKTLGEELDENDSLNFTFKKTAEGRVIQSYDGIENSDKYEWIITSFHTGEVFTKNVDAIKLDRDINFMIIYQEK